MLKIKILFFISFTLISISLFSYARGQFFYTNQSNNISSIDFLVDWTADTYVPSDYEGKALPTYGSRITLSATPLSVINENDYEFIWRIDLASSPENNKKPIANFTVKKRSGEHNVFLSIRDIKNKKTIKEVSFSIAIQSPQTIIYQKNQFGHFLSLNSYQDVGNIFNKNNQLDLVAKSFYFNQIKNLSSLRYHWSLNTEKIDSPEMDPFKLSVEFPKELPSGYSYNLSLLIENPFDDFQFSEKSYKIIVK